MTKQQRVWLIAGAAVAVVAVICCACVIAGYFWAIKDDPGDVVDDYLAAVQEHDQQAAADLVCDSWRGGGLAGVVTSFAEVVDWQIKDVDTGERSARVKAEVTYRLLGLVNTGDTTFTLIKEDGDWRVCGINTR